MITNETFASRSAGIRGPRFAGARLEGSKYINVGICSTGWTGWKVRDDHSFQLQCMREAYHAADDRRTEASSGGPLGGSSVSGSPSGINSSSEGVPGLSLRRAAEPKGSKRQWSSKVEGGPSGTGHEDGLLEGILMLQVSSLFNSPKLVLWKRVDEMLYMVVFDVTENCLLVSNFLTLFIHILADIFGVNADSPALGDLYQRRPDALLVTLHHLLPGGHLLFINIPRSQRIKNDIKDALRQGSQSSKS